MAADPSWPGATETFGDPCTDLIPSIRMQGIATLKDRPVILLATATITEENLYSNGLFQNVFVFYRLFEAMGYAPILIVNEKPKQLDGIPGPLRACRTIVVEDMFRQPMMNLVGMIEIGMSLDQEVRKFVKMLGGKLWKLYLGNILNIDIENSIFYEGTFAHHIVSKLDGIWVSPHYGQHVEYASILNHVAPAKNLSDMIAPYVWDPSILTRNGTQRFQWRPAATPEEEMIVIMEPNISFQKSFLVPLMIVEHWYRGLTASERLAWKGKVAVINGEKLTMNPHFRENVMPLFDVIRDGRVELLERCDIVSAMKRWPAATFVLHNVNNEFNYMTLELMWCGFPVLHNSPSWREFGYSYEGADIAGGAHTLTAVRRAHATQLEVYRSHAQALAWRHSPYNPTVHAAWKALLER